MAINCAARVDSDGKPVGAVLTGRPIGELRRAYEALNVAHTDLQRAQRKLIEQEKMASLGRLVAGVAHELNNPISFVYGNIHTLDRYRKSIESYLDALHGWAGPGDMPKLRRSLEIDTIVSDLQPLIEGTLEGAMRIAEIVKNLRRLSFTKTADRQEIEIGRLIRTAVAWATRAKNVRADVTIDVSDDLVMVGHEGQIHQVLVNLVDNAIDAVRDVDAPRLDFHARQESEDIVVEIGDSGPGIPDTVMDKIFEPFFTTKTVGEGTGLGLWISYSIVREHGGSLAAGRSPLGGALFTLRLPRR
jgi:two-component system sensor histidine kinase HupT/HoxJ